MVDTKDLVKKILEKDKRSIAKSITLIENEAEEAYTILKELSPNLGAAHIIGVTGAPGAGKSTLVNELVTEIRKKGEKVAVLAIDPTSPYTGGAFLADRIRMHKHFLDEGVYLRSLASRGYFGGLSRNTYNSVKIFDAAGYENVIIETVGVGQGEVDIAKVADTAIVVLNPNAGDEMQALKAGIMEIADIFVINKADLDGAQRTAAILGVMLMDAKEKPAIYKTIAINGDGVPELLTGITEKFSKMKTSGQLEKKRKDRLKLELATLVSNKVLQAMEKKIGKELESYIGEIYEKKKNIYIIAEEILIKIKN